MTEIILKSNLPKSKLDALLNFLKTFDVTVEIKESKKKNIKKFPFTIGIWEDYDITGKELREKSWTRK
ncbi:hypothetical protein [Halpernia frigidisoli]|uniref:Uncharacterized protein n=1 Tax=Halpernia frigidisoli TaxID=1125876 RepID=A0A1I3HRT0_9FLAO|nr:hypothetical protein [Halpernia frigidisoli]SFI38476.1 hypothetical protein SAMN05443292_2362 [Halpernia frigidisoli]